MPKKISMAKRVLYSSLLCSLALFGAEDSKQQEYGRGWLKYEDEPKQQSTSTADLKRASEKDLLIQLLQEQRLANKLQSETLEILKVVYDLPRMVEVDGKKCLSNSSEDCFVVPIIGDAARIPVMKQWIEKPTVENALAYYKWQAKYLNHSLNAGYSLEAAARNIAPPFAATPVFLNTGTGAGHSQREKLIDREMKKHGKNVELNILIGKNYGYDIENMAALRDIYNKAKSLDFKTRFVFESQERLNAFNRFHDNALNQEVSELWRNIPQTDKVISPNTFKSNKIETYMTPMYLMRYVDVQNRKSFTQVAGVGRDSTDTVFKNINKTLILFGVIKPAELNGIHAQEFQSQQMIKEIDSRHFVNDEEAKKRAPMFKETIQSEGKK